MYLAILFLLSSCYLVLLSYQNQSFYLFQFHIPTKFMTKKKIFLSGDLWVLDNVRLWNISFQGWHFPAFSRLYQQNFSCRQPLWRSLVNTSPISQFQENVSSFNFLANTLPMRNCGNGTETIINYFVHCTSINCQW